MMSPYLVGFIVMFGWLIVSCFMVDSLLTGGAWDKLTKFISLNHRFLTSGSIVNPRYPLSLRIGSGNSSNMATKKGQTHSLLREFLQIHQLNHDLLNNFTLFAISQS